MPVPRSFILKANTTQPYFLAPTVPFADRAVTFHSAVLFANDTMYFDWHTMTHLLEDRREMMFLSPPVIQWFMNSSQNKLDYISTLNPPSYSFQLLHLVTYQDRSLENFLWQNLLAVWMDSDAQTASVDIRCSASDISNYQELTPIQGLYSETPL